MNSAVNLNDVLEQVRACPGMPTPMIAEAFGLSTPKCMTKLAKLRKQGYLRSEKKQTGTSNHYICIWYAVIK